jgi:hypothetical protein
VRARVSAATTLQNCVEDADYVQENIAEKVDVKRRLYAEMDAAAPPDCILASSTSSIPTSVFSESVPGRQRCVVAHPVNPPHLVPLVEISPAPWTAPEVVRRTRELQEKVGQVPILVNKEIQGFILNRLQAALTFEAWRLVEEGYVSVEDADSAASYWSSRAAADERIKDSVAAERVFYALSIAWTQGYFGDAAEELVESLKENWKTLLLVAGVTAAAIAIPGIGWLLGGALALTGVIDAIHLIRTSEGPIIYTSCSLTARTT